MSAEKLFLVKVLDCGHGDLELLNGIDQEIFLDAIDHFLELDFSTIDFNSLVAYCFESVIHKIEHYLEYEFDINGARLIEGFSSFHNYIDTHAYLDIDKTKINNSDTEVIETIAEMFEEHTGFNLDINKLD